MWNDFALVELSASVNFSQNPHIRPACLPGRETVDYDDQIATVSGWGHQRINYLNPSSQGVVKGISSGNAKRLQKLNVRLVLNCFQNSLICSCFES